MKRRDFISKATGSLLFLKSFPLLATRLPFGSDKYNVLIIQTDQQSWWTLGAYGGSEISTPHMDAIGLAGTIFDNFFSNSPVCTPSRGCFMTGKYPEANGAYENDRPLFPQEITFGQVLRDAGYHTGYAGKWHLSGSAKPGWLASKNSYGFVDSRFMYNRGHWKKIVDASPEPKVFPYDVIGNAKTYTTDWLTGKAISFLNQNFNKPFCYMLSIPDPHDPFSVRSPYNRMYQNQEFSIAPTVPNEMQEMIQKTKKQYFGEVKLIDDCVGRILETLERRNLSQNTIVIFTTDHGEYMGEHGLMGKNDIYEAVIRIPLMIRWPQGMGGFAKRTSDILSTVDFAPTLLSMLGLSIPSTMQGDDFMPVLLGKTMGKNLAQIHYDDHKRAAIFDKEYGLAYTDSGSTGYLFDRNQDRFQQTNLFSNPQFREIISNLTKKMQDHHNKISSTARTWLNNLS